jgi:hypothetical protein
MALTTPAFFTGSGLELAMSLLVQARGLEASTAAPVAMLSERHHRMLGDLTRRAELDCPFESICRTRVFFRTGIELRSSSLAKVVGGVVVPVGGRVLRSASRQGALAETVDRSDGCLGCGGTL